MDSIYYLFLAGDTFKANSWTTCILCYWFAVRGFKAPLIDLIRNCGVFKIAVNKSRRGTLQTRSMIQVSIDSQLSLSLCTSLHSKGKNGFSNFALRVQWLSFSNVFWIPCNPINPRKKKNRLIICLNILFRAECITLLKEAILKKKSKWNVYHQRFIYIYISLQKSNLSLK